jgi:hypothetical protein
MKISSRDRKVAELIRDRQPFQTYGALRAEAVDGLSVWDSGQLSGEDEEQFREDATYVRYVVYSYYTPIAWWAGTRADFENMKPGWYIVKQRFSRTTSAHQGKLYLIPRCICDAPHPSTECEVHPTCQGEHVCDGLPLNQTTCPDRAAHM